MTVQRRSGNPSFAQQLRERCRPLHTQLDSHPAIASLATPAPHIDDYRHLLASMASVLPGHEAALHAALPCCGLAEWLPALSRTGPLASDCRALRVSAAPALAIARFRGREECLAVLYVLEGSRLGGTLIARNLLRSAAIAATAMQFLLAAPHPDCRWPALLAELDRVDGGTEAADQACARAEALFRHLLGSLEGASRALGAVA